MAIYKKIDLHMHSTVSDGTDTPAEILANVKKAGIELFALTDHDAIKGAAALAGTLQEGDPDFIPGIEFSCKDEEGKYHILGLGYAPDSEPINAVVNTGHGYRMKKLGLRLEFLKSEYGIEFPEEEIAGLYTMDNPGKPHIANLMAKYGYAQSKDDAIYNYLNKMHAPSKYVRPEEAIRGILGSGGIPVLAHPTYGDGDQLILGEDMDRRIRRLLDFGLQGLEGFYSGFTNKISAEILGFADRYGLYVTAGSDYHGRNKLIELADTGLTEDTEWPEGLTRFIEDVRICSPKTDRE
ncbi:MAG: PHP domain-containing protein [Lachnospiraceae bacterium]|nr:PHP domain-containing protein [Lachnospiraceae bacterium]